MIGRFAELRARGPPGERNLTLTLQANRQAELDAIGSALARLKFHPARSKLESHPDSLFMNGISSSVHFELIRNC